MKLVEIHHATNCLYAVPPAQATCWYWKQNPAMIEIAKYGQSANVI